MIWHILPVNDEREHEETGTCCWCNPEVRPESGNLLVVHNAADGRETVEEAERILAELNNS